LGRDTKGIADPHGPPTAKKKRKKRLGGKIKKRTGVEGEREKGSSKGRGEKGAVKKRKG